MKLAVYGEVCLPIFHLQIKYKSFLFITKSCFLHACVCCSLSKDFDFCPRTFIWLLYVGRNGLLGSYAF